MVPAMSEVVKRVEKKRGFHFLPCEIGEAVVTTERKCHMKRKNKDYFHLLLADELNDIVTRQEINGYGGVS